MGIRRFAALALVALVLGACGSPTPVTDAARDVLFLASANGLASFSTGSESPTFKGTQAVPSRDWLTAVESEPYGGKTRVVATDPRTGLNRWEKSVPGNLNVKIVSEGGDRVALSPNRERHYSLGRRETTLVITGPDLIESQRVTLEGNYEPEAFSTDGNSLFVVSYLPARNPNSYQVRRLDLTTGTVEGVYTPDAHLQERMGGTARVQVGSPDGTRLYTLYTLGRGDDRHAFIHVLSLDELWAHCIDLPDGFTSRSEKATALTVSTNGKRLYVANSETWTVTEIDTEELAVARTNELNFGSGRVAYGATSPGTTYFASGERVVAMDDETMTERFAWNMPDRIRGIQATHDARRLYIGLRDRVILVDALSGKELDVIDPLGVKRIARFGPVMLQPVPELEKYSCAC